MEKNDEEKGLLSFFSNKVFLIGLVIIVIISIGFYKKTEEQVKSQQKAYDVNNTLKTSKSD